MRELCELNRDRDKDERVWVKHYSSNHRILLVGEGDFSFSCSLATRFGSASNICASSLDSYDDVVRKYKKAGSNLRTLKSLGASLLHGVDATKLQLHSHLNCKRFDRVIFNFPHAGFHGKESDPYLIRKHRELVFGFLQGASNMVRASGEIHVSHKNNAPFSHWNLEELANKCSLALIRRVAFKKSDYPGYENKRGDGSRCDQPFILGDCSTFRFHMAKELYKEKMRCRQVKEGISKCPRFNKVSLGLHNGELQRMLTRTSFPNHYTKESSEGRRLLCHERSVRFTGVSHGIYKGKIRKMLIRTSHRHPYTRDSRERSMSRQSNLSKSGDSSRSKTSSSL